MVIIQAVASDSVVAGLRDTLERRLAANPHDATTRRMLGRILLEEGQVEAAIAQLQITLAHDPLSVAARFDLGRALRQSGDLPGAAYQWREVVEIAPQSEYAASALEELAALPPSAQAEVQMIAYEPREFPGPPVPQSILDPLEITAANLPPERLPLGVRLETGLLYNSNVALAPSSRQPAPGSRKSFQWFVAPEVEWAALMHDGWAGGPLLHSYFTLNESHFSDFNLQSYTPGLFSEWVSDRVGCALITRLEYRYGVDRFGGTEFSRRHSLLARMTALHHAGGGTTGYLAIDHTDFAEEGVLPEVTSPSGVTYSAGLAHEWHLNARWLSRLRAGIDLDRLDSRGSDFAYWGLGATGQAVVPLRETLDLTLRGGLGFRLYDRFEFEPDRDELVWRVGCELRKRFTPQLSTAAIFNYQNFDSNNPLFVAERMIAGLTMEYRY